MVKKTRDVKTLGASQCGTAPTCAESAGLRAAWRAVAFLGAALCQNPLPAFSRRVVPSLDVRPKLGVVLQLLVELLTKFVRKRTCDNIEDMIEELRIEERYTKDVPDRNGGSTSEEADEVTCCGD